VDSGIDAEQAALLVRVTARISAAILAADLLVAARRIADAASRGPRLRTIDVATFVTFLVSHTIHFLCVGLLTIATAGGNIRVRFGPIAVIASGLLFYLVCFAVLRVKRRPTAEWTSAGERRVEAFSMMALWIAFFQAYASRLLQSWFFVALAAVLLYSVARFVGVALRSGNHAMRFP